MSFLSKLLPPSRTRLDQRFLVSLSLLVKGLNVTHPGWEAIMIRQAPDGSGVDVAVRCGENAVNRLPARQASWL